MTHTRRLLAALGLVLALGTGCSQGSSTPPPATSAPATSAPAAPSTTSGSASPTPAGVACVPKGRYTVTHFVVAGDKESFGTGEGGDLTATFGNGGYRIVGSGGKPMVVTLAGAQAQLVVDGTVRGTMTGRDGSALRFGVSGTSGSATLAAGGQKQTLTMAQVANILAPTGDGHASCNGSATSIYLSRVRLDLTR